MHDEVVALNTRGLRGSEVSLGSLDLMICMERSLEAQQRSCFVVLLPPPAWDRSIYATFSSRGKRPKISNDRIQNTPRREKKRFDRRAGEEDGTVLTERGRGRSISPTPCFWDKGYSPCSASCRRCGVFSESESRTRTGIGSGGLNDHKHRRRAKSIGRAGERERFQIA